MIIEDKVGPITVQIGKPSENHLRLTVENISLHTIHMIEMGYPDWVTLKSKVDRMFEAAGMLNKKY